jgi:hypothetical protein
MCPEKVCLANELHEYQLNFFKIVVTPSHVDVYAILIQIVGDNTTEVMGKQWEMREESKENGVN